MTDVPALTYTINSLADAEEATGENLLAVLTKIGEGTMPSFRQLRILVWAGLNGAGQKVSQAEAGVILSQVGTGAMMERVGEAMKALLEGARG